jgi:hypothetical protein
MTAGFIEKTAKNTHNMRVSMIQSVETHGTGDCRMTFQAVQGHGKYNLKLIQMNQC